MPFADYAMLFLMIACGIAATASAAFCGVAGLVRLEPEAVGRIDRLPWAALAGSFVGMAVAVSQTGLSGPVQVAPSMWVFLGAFFAAASLVDVRTYWAPDELVLPFCVLAGSVGIANYSSGFWGLQGPVSGLALWVIGRILWRLQIAADLRFMPPPDFAAVVMPLLLFGPDIRAALAYSGCAAALTGIRVYRWRRRRACDPNPPVHCSGHIGGRTVPFLGVALPMNLIAGLIQ